MTTTHTTDADHVGALHTGSGDLYVLDVASLFRDEHGNSPRQVAEDQLRWLRQRFVAPLRFDEARDRLRRNRTVLLNGQPGSGRTTAGRVLLNATGDESGTYREIEPDTGESGPLLDPEWVGRGDRLLLDLAGADRELWTAVGRELLSFRQIVHEQGALLVVVLPDRTGERVHEVFLGLRVSIEVPSRMAVLRRHLRYASLVPEDAAISEELLSFLRTKPPMRDVAYFADLVRRARDNDPAASFAEWCERARHALVDRAEEVEALVAQQRKGAQRTLLLATAMLHGARADVVHRASEDLLRRVGCPADPRPMLVRDDLAQRFAEIKVATDGQNAVHFVELGFDTAVRAHFWNHMPDLRPYLRDWVGSLPGEPNLSAEDRDNLIGRYTTQLLRTGPPEDLAALVERWTRKKSETHVLRAAALALTGGVRSERHGRYFHRKIYDWSTDDNISSEHREVLVGVCSEVMAVRQPDLAMVRLHHLARRQKPGHSARRALLALAERDDRIRDRVLKRLAHGTAYRRARDRDVDVTLFLAGAARFAQAVVAAPTTPGDLSGVHDDAVVCWGAVLADVPEREWASAAATWFCAARGVGGDAPSPLLDVLVRACDGRGERYGRLYAAARTWARTPVRTDPAAGGTDTVPDRGARLALADRLLHAISAAQGIGSRARGAGRASV